MTQKQTTLKDYELSRSIGRGNTSDVRLGKGPDGKEYAIKLPLPETLQQKDSAERFGNEVRLTMRFEHPHLIRAYGGVAFGPQAFLALEYYPKGALSDHLRGRMDTKEALRILADLASALTHLHEAGAVHQDVKPQNIYVKEGRAALGDLGSAYFLSQGSKTSGSPFYMAPEVYHGEPTSGASDVYSLGVTAYELLSGQRPFMGNSYEELMVAHLSRFPAPLGSLSPELPRSLTRLIDRSFAKRASERPSARTMYEAFLEALGEKPAPATPATPSEPVPSAGRHIGPVTPAAAPTPAAPPRKKRVWWNPLTWF